METGTYKGLPTFPPFQTTTASAKLRCEFGYYRHEFYYCAGDKRPGSGYLELENHSDALHNMDTFTTPTVIITGCNYNYIVQMLTPHYFEHHLADTTVIPFMETYMQRLHHYVTFSPGELLLRELQSSSRR